MHTGIDSWKHSCKILIKKILKDEDSVEFRDPVNKNKYPVRRNYKIISNETFIIEIKTQLRIMTRFSKKTKAKKRLVSEKFLII